MISPNIVARHVGTHSDPHHAHMEVARCGVAHGGRRSKHSWWQGGGGGATRARRRHRTCPRHRSGSAVCLRRRPFTWFFLAISSRSVSLVPTPWKLQMRCDADANAIERLRNCCSVPWTDRALCSAPKSEGTTSRYDLVCPPGPGKQFTYVLPVRFCGGYNCCVRFRVMARRASGAESMSGQRSGPSWESGTGAWGDGGSLRAGCYRAAGLVLRSDGSSVEFERLGPCLVFQKFCKIFQILSHIESLDVCMKY